MPIVCSGAQKDISPFVRYPLRLLFSISRSAIRCPIFPRCRAGVCFEYSSKIRGIVKSYFDCGLFDLMIGNEKIFGMFDPAHIQKFNERKICTAVEQLADVILTEVKRFGNIMQAEVAVGMIVQDVIQDRSHLLMRGVISLHFMRGGQRLIHAEKKRIEFVCAVMLLISGIVFF